MDRCSEFDPFRADSDAPSSRSVEQKSVSALFEDFYRERGDGESPSEADRQLLAFAQEISEHADVHAVPADTQIHQILDFLMKQEGNE